MFLETLEVAGNLTNLEAVLAGGAIAGVLLILLFVFLIFTLGVFIYTAFAWMAIAKRLNYKYPWLAFIPFARTAMVFQMGKKFHWAWVFLYLIPVFGWIALLVLGTISVWKIFEMRKFHGALSLVYLACFIPYLNWLGIIASMIVVGFVAWGEENKITPIKLNKLSRSGSPKLRNAGRKKVSRKKSKRKR